MLIASKSSFAILAYDLNDEPHELLSMVIDEEEEIKMITFLDDENPSYILLITYDHQEQLTISRILNIKQEQVALFLQMKKDRE